MNRATLIIAIIFILIAAFVFAILVYLRISSPKKTLPQPTPIPTLIPTAIPTPSTDTIQSGGKVINNPYKGAQELTRQGDVLAVSNDRFQISYLMQFDLFLIIILQEPFETHRAEAETLFLEKLDITEADACALDVTVNPPKKEGELRPKYRLSFCE